MDIMTKVRVLWEKVAGITADVSAVDAKATATAATLAGILPRIPADYSTNETATGQKWIDGKDIYCKVFSGTLPELQSSQNVAVITDLELDSLISFDAILYNSSSIYKTANRFTNVYDSVLKKIELTGVSTTYSEGTYYCILYYTKSDPVPAQVDKGTGMITGEDPEPETKKRKTTKKEEK